jgi:glucosamine-phosphate N-acetyltransferase
MEYMENIIRKLTKDDYESFLIIINEFRETQFTKKQFYKTLENVKTYSEIWIIENNSEIIAIGTIIYEEKFIHNIGLVGHIEDICVKSKYRKLGLGKKIVEHLLQEAKNKNCYKIILDCSEENKKFYENCGFKQNSIQMSVYNTNNS